MDQKEKLLKSEEIACMFPEVAEFIGTYSMMDIPCRRYQLPKGIYVNIESYVTQPREVREYESHKRYIDLQYIISGEENISVCRRDLLQIRRKYESRIDIEFYTYKDGRDYLLRQGDCLLLYPDNAHMPCIRNGNEGSFVKKAVFKIPLHYFVDIKCLVMDVDGTLTDGKIYMGNSGEFMKAFHVKDGYGISTLLPTFGISPVVITGRKSEIVLRRCEELGIREFYQGIADKAACLLDTVARKNIPLSLVAYMGDDLNDLICMEKVKEAGGIVGCPFDAAEQIKEISDYISMAKGGDGAVREFIDWIAEKMNYLGMCL